MELPLPDGLNISSIIMVMKCREATSSEARGGYTRHMPGTGAAPDGPIRSLAESLAIARQAPTDAARPEAVASQRARGAAHRAGTDRRAR